jgi:uncharacterized damage-inducible protein DinB
MNGNLMPIDVIRVLYDYNAWANNRVLSAAAKLTAEQFLAAAAASYDSIQDTLVHTMSGQWIWLSRWRGMSPGAMLESAKFPDLASIRYRWREIEDHTKQFITNLDSNQLSEDVVYLNTSGVQWVYPLWQLMIHQVNHATQHRSEVALMLTHFGHSPGELDLLLYYAQLAPSE